jgi:hypothetical protein
MSPPRINTLSRDMRRDAAPPHDTQRDRGAMESSLHDW